jgi:hypothetical protein
LTSIEDLLFASDKCSSHSGSEFRRILLFAARLFLVFQTVAVCLASKQIRPILELTGREVLYQAFKLLDEKQANCAPVE